MLSQSLMGYWRVESNLELMNYIRNNDMYITGVDAIPHAKFPKKELYLAVYEDLNLANSVFKLDSIFFHEYQNKKSNYYVTSIDQSDIEYLDSISGCLIVQYQEVLRKLNHLNLRKRNLLKWGIESVISTMNYSNHASQTSDHSLKFTQEEEEYRDQKMAGNIEYLLDSIYPNEKIIVWAHNAHISKTGTINRSSSSIGLFLNENTLKKSFIIGLGAINGTYSEGNEKPKNIELYKYNIEKQFLSLETKGIFLTNNHFKMRKRINSLGFLYSKEFDKMFDGIILLKDVSGSSLIRYDSSNTAV